MGLIAGAGAAIALADSATTGTNVACATATLAAHTLGVDGVGVYTISGTSTTDCHTETYTVPTVTVAATAPTVTAATPPSCDLYASPTGSDGDPGTQASPFRSVQKLSDSLRSGQTGCLRQGDYGQSVQTRFRTANVTIRSYPGESATVHGWPYVSADSVTLSYLAFDLDLTGDSWPALCQGAVPGGANVTYGMELAGNDDVLEHSEVYVDPSVPLTQRGGGVGAGFNTSPTGTIIRYDRIHDVGFCPVEEHGVYLDRTTNAQVYGNWIYSIPAGVGVQVWDHAHGAHVYSNVIDGASSCVDVGSNTNDTANTLVEHNVCSNMVGLQSPNKDYCTNPPGPGCTGPDPGQPIFDWWGGSPGPGNVMQNNLAFCVSPAHCSTSYAGASGVSLSGNTTGNPQYLNGAQHDYRVGSTSPAASWGLWNGDLP